MSLPTPGNYFIVNTVPNWDGELLAINFTGSGNSLDVVPLVTNQTSQVWTINNYDSNTQSISPYDDSTLQIAFGGGYTFTTLPAHNYVWTIRGDTNYTFQDGHMTIYWDLNSTDTGSNVTYSSESGDQTQYWWLYPTY